MAIYKGKNNNKKTKSFFYTRVKYRIEAFDTLGPNLLKSVKDFTFTDFAMYGKINDLGFPVIPRQDSLVSHLLTPSQEKPIKMLGFVGVQLSDLLNLIDRNIVAGRISINDSFLSRLRPLVGYINPFDEYNLYLNDMMSTFTKRFVKKNSNSIKSFNDYLNLFSQFVTKITPEYPCTFSGWYTTRYCTPFSTGIYIDMLGISKHIDSEKEQIVTDSNFPFYVNACQQYGFSISKNNPNIIVSDLSSPAHAKYITEYGIAGVRQIFNNLYRRADEYDLLFLDNFLKQGYNNLRSRQPNTISFQIGKNGHMISNLSLRDNINNNNINKYIKLYIIIRNKEENNYYNKHEINEMIKNVSFFSKKLDTSALIEYINFQYLVNRSQKVGSLAWYTNRLEG